MILRKRHRILIVGMTGKQGTFWSRAMLDYGCAVCGGVNPRKAGTTHLGRPVFGSAADARRESGFDVALLFVPPAAAKVANRESSSLRARTVATVALTPASTR